MNLSIDSNQSPDVQNKLVASGQLISSLHFITVGYSIFFCHVNVVFFFKDYLASVGVV
jgi:hypothetical protein